MENNKRRLLKDLPFDNLTEGDVLFRGGRGHGGDFSMSRGETYYEGGGHSSNGIEVFSPDAEAVLAKIWDDEEWFEDANLEHIDFSARTDSITLKFKPIDIEDAQDLMRGIIHILPEIEKEGWVWSKFKGITTSIKNN